MKMTAVHDMLEVRRLSPKVREFYIDGVTYLTSGSDFVMHSILYRGEYTQVSNKGLFELAFNFEC